MIKVRVKKLAVDIFNVERAIDTAKFERLSITAAHLAVLKNLPTHHRDPFDHLLIAQSISEAAVLITADRAIRGYPVDLFE